MEEYLIKNIYQTSQENVWTNSNFVKIDMLCTSTLKCRSLKSSIKLSGCPTQAWQCLGHPDLRIPRKCPRHPGPDKLGFKWVGFGLTSVRFCVALGAALGFAIGVALGVAFGVALGIALGVVFGVAWVTKTVFYCCVSCENSVLALRECGWQGNCIGVAEW